MSDTTPQDRITEFWSMVAPDYEAHAGNVAEVGTDEYARWVDYVREALPRFVAGAAFVFLEDLPPAEDLALTTLSRGSAPLQDDLLRLDDIDDVDLYADKPDATSR